MSLGQWSLAECGLCIYRSSGSGVCCSLSSRSVWCHMVSLSCLFELVLSPVCEGVCGFGVDGMSEFEAQYILFLCSVSMQVPEAL